MRRQGSPRLILSKISGVSVVFRRKIPMFIKHLSYCKEFWLKIFFFYIRIWWGILVNIPGSWYLPSYTLPTIGDSILYSIQKTWQAFIQNCKIDFIIYPVLDLGHVIRHHAMFIKILVELS